MQGISHSDSHRKAKGLVLNKMASQHIHVQADDSEEEKVWSEEEEETRPRTRPRYLSNPKCQYVGGKIVKRSVEDCYLLIGGAVNCEISVR